ncbi:hypothetical protein GW590_02655 [Rahnella sp. SAP-1]|uniref:Uncharacterized protein n=1 Tax=Rouxiella aceris TaxID=2703884 RepID=A0A848MC00_9GAMM|nr:hypothetical protein [Rouxiella aceris]
MADAFNGPPGIVMRMAGDQFSKLFHHIQSIKHQLADVDGLAPNPHHRRNHFLPDSG